MVAPITLLNGVVEVIDCTCANEHTGSKNVIVTFLKNFIFLKESTVNILMTKQCDIGTKNNLVRHELIIGKSDTE